MQRNNNQFDAGKYSLLKAEAFCAGLMSGRLSFEQVTVSHEGAFKRSFRSDIDKVNFWYDEKVDRYIMDIAINRDGIYDRLPEGVFHQTKGNSKTLTTREMVDEYQRYRDEEKYARKFFQPLEQEFFQYAVLAQKEEHDLAFGMLKGNLRKELNRFWDIPEDLPREPANVLLRIRPWVSRIKGHMQLTAKALELMLGKPVDVCESCMLQQQNRGVLLPLGEGLLGIDTVPGTHFEEPSLCWRFTIGQLSKEEMELYPEHKPYGKFLKQFEEIFIPLTVDVFFDYSIMEPSAKKAEEVLGYGFIL